MRLHNEGHQFRVDITFQDLQRFRKSRPGTRLAKLLHLHVRFNKKTMWVENIHFANGTLAMWACTDLDALVIEAKKFVQVRSKELQL